MVGRNSQPHCFCYWFFLGCHPTYRACGLSVVLQVILCLLFPLPISLGYNICSELTYLISQRLCPKEGQCHHKCHLKNRPVTSIHNRAVIWSGVTQNMTRTTISENIHLKTLVGDHGCSTVHFQNVPTLIHLTGIWWVFANFQISSPFVTKFLTLPNNTTF